ncbi:RICIN domain-containing protein [Streptomyces sp. NPDC006798]|uniref:RICIN domain-containing protein n=1 Tax=Streptomyces sp. NPDC006798 TaxID=3155462 RepID=UPI0033D8989E
MSDQHKASGEPAGRPAGSAAEPDAEAVAADLLGRGTSRTGSRTPEPARETESEAPKTGASESRTTRAGEEERSAGTNGANGTNGTNGTTAAGREPESGAPEPGKSESDPEPESERSGSGASGSEEPEAGEKAEKPGSAANGESAVAAAAPAATSTGAGAATTAVAATAAAARAGKTRRGAAATAAGSGGDADGPDTREPGRIGKPVLAGAAMVGVLLAAVPLLIMATSKGEEKNAVNTGAAEHILNDEDDPAGAFIAESPPPSKPAKKEPSKKPVEGKKEESKARPGGGGQAAVPPPPPGTGPEAKSGQPGQSGPKTKPKSKPKSQARGAASDLPAVLTRVLIRNNTNGTCVDVPGYSSGRPDTEIHHATCNNTNGDNQLWSVERRYADAGPGGVPLFQIRNVMDSMCLDLPGYGGVGGATGVTEYPCNGTTKDNQLWWLDKRADGKYWIRNYASNNQCLDSYSNSEKERQLIIWPCAPEGQNNHEWSFARS